ncbi:MAG: hypothetical protein KF892_08460 [Rhizobacter sp.]|nr:hypothetical protein [Rhizobacter sp.]
MLIRLLLAMVLSQPLCAASQDAEETVDFIVRGIRNCELSHYSNQIVASSSDGVRLHLEAIESDKTRTRLSLNLGDVEFRESDTSDSMSIRCRVAKCFDETREVYHRRNGGYYGKPYVPTYASNFVNVNSCTDNFGKRLVAAHKHLLTLKASSRKKEPF